MKFTPALNWKLIHKLYLAASHPHHLCLPFLHLRHQTIGHLIARTLRQLGGRVLRKTSSLPTTRRKRACRSLRIVTCSAVNDL